MLRAQKTTAAWLGAHRSAKLVGVPWSATRKTLVFASNAYGSPRSDTLLLHVEALLHTATRGLARMAAWLGRIFAACKRFLGYGTGVLVVNSIVDRYVSTMLLLKTRPMLAKFCNNCTINNIYSVIHSRSAASRACKHRERRTHFAVVVAGIPPAGSRSTSSSTPLRPRSTPSQRLFYRVAAVA